jgi:preprotein translocase subunit SecD
MSIFGTKSKAGSSSGRSYGSRSSNNLIKDWKPVTTILVLIWSVLNLFQIKSTAEVKELQRLANLTGTQLHQEIIKRVEKLPNWSKFNSYQKEDAIKREYDESSLGNNIQVLATVKGNKIFTNLKLGLDLRGGSQLLLKANPAPPGVPEITPDVMKGVEAVINNRINSLGVSETIVQRAGKDRLIVEMPGIKDPQQAKDRIGTTALLEFKELDFTSEGMPIWKDTGLTGRDFKRAQATPMAGGTWEVGFEFKPDGAKKFADLTKRLSGRFIGIFLDGQPTDRGPDGKPLPIEHYPGVRVNEPITGGRGQITGSFSQEQAVDLAQKLNAGALPVPVQILEERTVGATLGQDSINKSLLAGAVGICAVMVFMVAIYGLPGLIADLALILYTLATLAIFKAIPVTLTLAGIAGFILSIGMAVDANILIFERTKEELNQGKNIWVAVENGFSRAMSSIFDSNVNSLIACSVLMLFGTTLVKGFAVTLAIGVAVSMFTAVTATRAMLHLIPTKLGLFGHSTDKTGKKVLSKEAV